VAGIAAFFRNWHEQPLSQERNTTTERPSIYSKDTPTAMLILDSSQSEARKKCQYSRQFGSYLRNPGLWLPCTPAEC
jgi:hypothetical protein